MRKKAYGLILAAVVALLVAMPLLQGCKPAAPAKPKVIKIGAAWDMTGAASSVAIPSIKAMEDTIRDVNDKGGIEGVRVDFAWFDTNYRVEREVSGYKRFVAEKTVGVSIMSAGGIEAVKDSAAQDKMPLWVVSPSLPTMAGPHPWVFSSMPAVGDAFTAFMMYLKDNWKKPGKPKVALLGWDTPYGREAETSAKIFASQFGVEVVSTQRISPVATEAASQLQAMAAANPDYIYTTTVAAPAAMILRDAKRLGLWPKIQFVGAHWDASDEALAIGGKDLFEGLLGVRPLATWDEDVPGIKRAKDLQARYQGTEIRQIGYELGTIAVLPMLEAVRIAIKDKGWENVDGEAIKAGFYKIKNLDVGGLTPPQNFTPQEHRGSPYERIVKIQGGKIVPVSDWIKVPLAK